MEKSKPRALPHFRSLDELVKFFDTHDLGGYWEEMPEAHFEIDIKKRIHLFTLDAELAGKLTEIARSRKTPSGTLIKTWLKEKIHEQV